MRDVYLTYIDEGGGDRIDLDAHLFTVSLCTCSSGVFRCLHPQNQHEICDARCVMMMMFSVMGAPCKTDVRRSMERPPSRNRHNDERTNFQTDTRTQSIFEKVTPDTSSTDTRRILCGWRGKLFWMILLRDESEMREPRRRDHSAMLNFWA